MVSNIFYFPPYLGKIPILTSIFFRWVGSTTNQMMLVRWFLTASLVGDASQVMITHVTWQQTPFFKGDPLWGSRIIFGVRMFHSFRGFSMRCKDPTSMKNAGFKPQKIWLITLKNEGNVGSYGIRGMDIPLPRSSIESIETQLPRLGRTSEKLHRYEYCPFDSAKGLRSPWS